jgi:hypothetical protein
MYGQGHHEYRFAGLAAVGPRGVYPSVVDAEVEVAVVRQAATGGGVALQAQIKAVAPLRVEFGRDVADGVVKRRIGMDKCGLCCSGLGGLGPYSVGYVPPLGYTPRCGPPPNMRLRLEPWFGALVRTISSILTA